VENAKGFSITDVVISPDTRRRENSGCAVGRAAGDDGSAGDPDRLGPHSPLRSAVDDSGSIRGSSI
jgi:hypothetical protein